MIFWWNGSLVLTPFLLSSPKSFGDEEMTEEDEPFFFDYYYFHNLILILVPVKPFLSLTNVSFTNSVKLLKKFPLELFNPVVKMNRAVTKINRNKAKRLSFSIQILQKYYSIFNWLLKDSKTAGNCRFLKLWKWSYYVDNTPEEITIESSDAALNYNA